MFVCTRGNIPVIRCLHTKITANRHRFAKGIQVHFKEFLDAVKGNSQWKVFLLDSGKGDAPLKYLALVEMGLRNFGGDIHAMGSGLTRS